MSSMLVCDICTQEVPSEDDMKSHLLLAHMEENSCCPFCTIVGLTYDELTYHINTAHSDSLELEPWNSDEEQPQEFQKAAPSSPEYIDRSPAAVGSKQHIEHILPEQSSPVSLEKNSTKQNNLVECIQIDDTTESLNSSPVASNTESLPLPVTPLDPDVCNASFDSDSLKESGCQASASAQHTDFDVDTVMECPFCCETTISIEELEFHVKMEHADLVDTPTKETSRQRFECPICSLVCPNCRILQEHVNLHLEENVRNEASADGFSKDSMLARQLQAEEDKHRREEEAQKEKLEFQKLQRQFGLDNSGGFRQQSMQNLERAVVRGRLQPMEFHLQKAQMMESIATGVDDGRTTTSGVLEALRHYYSNAAPEVSRVWLCSPVDHFSNSAGDKGWGCGFRNCQMLLSSILKSSSYRNCLQGCRYIPCIPKLQSMIENAWREGFDPQGASHFNGKLQGTKAWIGACEIYCLLTSLHIKCRILDFHKPSSSSGTHPLLFDWVLNYYSSDVCHSPGKVVCSSKPAIYLQHQGHSRTIVGIEERKNKSYCLLIFDPGHPPEIVQRLTRHNLDNSALKILRKHFSSLKHKQYQIVAVEGALSPEEKAVRLQKSKVFRAERIP